MEEYDDLEIGLKNKESILLKNKCRILRMPNNKNKVELLGAYFSLLEYYQTLLGKRVDAEKFDISEEIDKYYRYIITDTANSVDELEYNAKLLYDKYKEIIELYKEKDFCQYQYIELKKVNKIEMEDAIFNFFDVLGPDVLKIYCDMSMNGNIFLTNKVMERLGFALNSTPIDNACISLKNIPYYLEFYVTLAHEVGHCYQFYLQKNQRNYSMIDPYCEITSILFEKLFIEYVKGNHLIKPDLGVDLDNHIILLSNVVISKALCRLLIEKRITSINPFNLEYECNKKKEEIEEEMRKDSGYIPLTHMSLELTEFSYSIGNIISNYFLEKLKINFDEGWKEFTDFICTINYLPMEEIINKYFDSSLIDKNVKKLIKSYQER